VRGPLKARHRFVDANHRILSSSSCTAEGYYDVFDMPTCNAILADGYYKNRDQNFDGVDDSEQFTNFFTNATNEPPGCWPVDPAIQVDFVSEYLVDTLGLGIPPDGALPLACINNSTVGTDCSFWFPCFCTKSA